MAAHLATTPLAFSAQPTWPLIVPWRRVRISWALLQLWRVLPWTLLVQSPTRGALPLLTMSRLLLCAGAAAAGCHCRRFAPHLFVLDPGKRAGLTPGWPGVGARRKRSSWRAAWTSRAARARGELELTGEPTSSCIHQIGRAGKASTFFAEAGVI